MQNPNKKLREMFAQLREALERDVTTTKHLRELDAIQDHVHATNRLLFNNIHALAQATLKQIDLLESGEAAQVLDAHSQEAACWAKIEAWCKRTRGWAEIVPPGDVEMRFAPDKLEYGVNLLEHRTRSALVVYSGGGATRLDALAHAAQWCEMEISK